MKLKFLSLFALATGLLTTTIACGTDDSAGDTDEGALGGRAGAAEERDLDQDIVGTWVDDSGDQLIVHTLELRGDGTFHAKGGCRTDGGTQRCYQVSEAKGRWSVASANARGAAAITLKESRGPEHKYVYTSGRIAGLGANALIIREKVGDTQKATFKRLADDVLAPGDVCVAGRSCADGFECRSNCPRNAMCIVNIETCQAKARLQQGAVCGAAGATQQCDEGLVCKDNCPQGAMCFVSIFTCQPR